MQPNPILSLTGTSPRQSTTAVCENARSKHILYFFDPPLDSISRIRVISFLVPTNPSTYGIYHLKRPHARSPASAVEFCSLSNASWSVFCNVLMILVPACVFAFGFLASFKPSEPFLVPYLTGIKNLTIDSVCLFHVSYFDDFQVNDQIFPVWTYSYLAFLLPLGIFAELLSYKAVLLFGWCARLTTRLILLFGSTVIQMQVMQIAFGPSPSAICPCTLY